MISSITKRNGTVVPFDEEKISNALWRANMSVVNERFDEADLDSIVSAVVERLSYFSTVTVEIAQDIVERELVKRNWFAVAKSYILYRARRTAVRESDPLMQLFHDITFKDAKDVDAKRENANINADTAMGTMLKYGTTASNWFIDRYILPKHLAEAHISGAAHYHDKDFFLLTETCCQIDLLKLFKGGFTTGHGLLREPSNIISAAALACIAIQSNQNDQHGGQAVPHFDYCMAPYVKKTYDRYYKEAYDTACSFGRNQSADEYARDVAHKKTDRAVYQAMEALIHNLNTMHSRAGAQTPFSSINYGTDTSEEGRMVIRNLLLATQAGLGDGETPIFPVQIFKVKEGVNYNSDDPNYDLFKLAMETSAKRLFPNFSFLDAPFNKQYLKKNADGKWDWNTEVAYMGCRTRVMGNPYDPTKEVTCGRGNLSFTTINLPRIALESDKVLAEFDRILEERLELVHEELLFRFKIQGKRKVRNYPFLMGNGIWLDSDKLNWDDDIAEVLKHGTLTVGFIGLAECLKYMLGVHHGESDEAQHLGLMIVEKIRHFCDMWSKQEQLNYSCIATPAEGLSGRFVPLDRARYGTIEGVTDRAYYTNSFHVPVYYPIKAFRKIQLEAPYHTLTNGGHITYVELDGDTVKNPEAFESIIRYMHDQGVGYGSINHPVDRDPVCGYTGVIDEICPRCGRREGESISEEKLKEIRRKYHSA